MTTEAALLGLIVNPIAGMGGAVGLKGTDGAETLDRARALGAVPHAAERARRALAVLADAVPDAAVVVAPGAMGVDAVAGLRLDISVVLDARPGRDSTAADTGRAARAMAERGVAAILFAGGDGTARDIVAEVGLDTPVLGIPCGVKMQSGVFAVSPEAAGRITAALVRGDGPRVGLRKVEIMDIDEEAVRVDRIAARLYGYARSPYAGGLLQAAKGASRISDEAMLTGACVEIAAALDPETLYLIGPGTSAKRVLSALRLEGTLLGVDAVRDRALVGRDLSARAALDLAGNGPLKIIVGVIGRQGFVFGRGNQQIGPEAIRRAGRDGIVIVASGEKLASLADHRLLVDTGDPALDAELAGYVRVHTGPGRATMIRMDV